MFAAMGWNRDGLGGSWDEWAANVAATLSERSPDQLAVFVVDRPDGVGPPSGGLVAVGAGTIAARLPSPRQPDGRGGYVQWMSTEPGYQRRGYGRAILARLLRWYDAQGIATVELHATPEGTALYRSEGFWEGTGAVALRRRPWDPPPETSS
jgi:GNAT superfamily N-acetyltransferase